MTHTLHLTDKPTGTHIGTVTDVLAWTVDDLGKRYATVTVDGTKYEGVSLDSLEAVRS